MNIIDNIKRHKYLIVLLLFAVLLRVLAALYMGDQPTILPGIHDELSYDALARNLLAGKGYSFNEGWYPFTPPDSPTAFWSFLYPIILAIIYKIFGYHPFAARLLQGVVGGGLTILLVYAIARRLSNERVALTGAALTAVYGYFIYYNAALMTETFFIVAILFLLYFCLKIREDPSVGNWFGMSLSLGVATLLRQAALIVLPLFLFWLIWELKGRFPWRRLAIPVITILCMLLPWTVRNYLVFHRFLLLNSNVGYALYAANHPILETTWQPDKVVVPIPVELNGKNEAELNDALLKLGLKFMIDDPKRYILLTASKLLEYIKFWPSRSSNIISNLVRVASFGLYLPFMIWGAVLSFRNWRKYLPLYIFVVSYALIHILSWPAPRYRLPVDAIMMPVAALAVQAGIKQLLSWKVLPFARRFRYEEEL